MAVIYVDYEDEYGEINHEEGHTDSINYDEYGITHERFYDGRWECDGHATHVAQYALHVASARGHKSWRYLCEEGQCRTAWYDVEDYKVLEEIVLDPPGYLPGEYTPPPPPPSMDAKPVNASSPLALRLARRGR